MNDEAVREVAQAMLDRLAGDLSKADDLASIGLAIAADRGLTEEETAAAFDQALVQLKVLRLRVMHVSDQRAAADEQRRQSGE